MERCSHLPLFGISRSWSSNPGSYKDAKVEKKPEIEQIMEPTERKLRLNTVGEYLEKIGKRSLLTEEEERALARKIKEGRRELTCCVIEASNIIKNSPHLLSLYTQEGRSIENFDEVKVNLERVREVADFLERKEKRLSFPDLW